MIFQIHRWTSEKLPLISLSPILKNYKTKVLLAWRQMPTEAPCFGGRPQAPLNVCVDASGMGWGGRMGWREALMACCLLLSLYWKCLSILRAAFGWWWGSFCCHRHVLVDAISGGVVLLNRLPLLCSGICSEFIPWFQNKWSQLGRSCTSECFEAMRLLHECSV